MSKKACIAFAEGCPRSYIDTAVLYKYFEANGWEITQDPSQADMVLVGTCAFSKLSEEISVNLFSSIAKRSQKAKLFAFGCLPGINKSVLLKRFDAVPIMRSELNKLDDVIDAEVQMSEITDVNILNGYVSQAMEVFTPDERKRAIDKGSLLLRATHFASCRSPYPELAHESNGREIYNIRVGHGCLSKCSYCAIRKALGDMQSKPLDKIEQEFSNGLANGHKRFSLIAEDVGAYGQDIRMNIVGLLKMLFSYKDNFILSWDDFNPRWLLQYSSELIPLLSDNQHRIGHIGLPVQSGSDRILHLMKREYRSGDLLDCLSDIRIACPEIQIDTHFILGFPGESSYDFNQTLHFLEKIKFYRALPFVYTDRPGTESINMPGKVSTAVKVWRFWQFRKKATSIIKSSR